MDVAREKALRERVAELEEEVRQLRAQLEPQMDWRFLRLSLTHSRILSILYAASPYTATHERLETVSTRECVRNHLKTLRPRLAPLGDSTACTHKRAFLAADGVGNDVDVQRVSISIERARADAERTRADEERARADEERARAERLAAQLRAAGIEPE